MISCRACSFSSLSNTTLINPFLQYPYLFPNSKRQKIVDLLVKIQSICRQQNKCNPQKGIWFEDKKIVGKGQNAGYLQFSLFFTMYF